MNFLWQITLNSEFKNKDKPRLIGEYLPCSRGAKRLALKKKYESRASNQPKRLGDILLEDHIITQVELEFALRRQRADRLSWCPLFESLDKKELMAIANKFTEINIQADEQFIFESEVDPVLYVLVDGTLEVFSQKNEGKIEHITYVEPFEPIGEMGYFQGGVRTASVRTVTPAVLLASQYSQLTHYFEHVPRVAQAFLEIVNQRNAVTAA